MRPFIFEAIMITETTAVVVHSPCGCYYRVWRVKECMRSSYSVSLCMPVTDTYGSLDGAISAAHRLGYSSVSDHGATVEQYRQASRKE